MISVCMHECAGNLWRIHTDPSGQQRGEPFQPLKQHPITGGNLIKIQEPSPDTPWARVHLPEPKRERTALKRKITEMLAHVCSDDDAIQ